MLAHRRCLTTLHIELVDLETQIKSSGRRKSTQGEAVPFSRGGEM